MNRPSATGGQTLMVRRTIHYSGRVQGVGFRFTTEAVARRFEITGFVRNLSDGSVELVAEGAESEVDRFQAAVEDAMRQNIREIQATTAPATDEFSEFSIAFR